MINVRITGADEIERALKRLPEWKGRAAMNMVGEHLEAKFKPYPPARHGPQPFKTDKQRRYFFWALGENKIVVPYERTMNLKNKWFYAPRQAEVTLANTMPYASWVQGEEQSQYHTTTGWKKARETAEQEMPRVIEILKREIERLWSSL